MNLKVKKIIAATLMAASSHGMLNCQEPSPPIACQEPSPPIAEAAQSLDFNAGAANGTGSPTHCLLAPAPSLHEALTVGTLQSFSFYPLASTAGAIVAYIVLYKAAIPTLYLSFWLTNAISQIAPISLTLNLMSLLSNPIVLLLLFGLILLERFFPDFFETIAPPHVKLALQMAEQKVLLLINSYKPFKETIEDEIKNADLKQVFQSLVLISVVMNFTQPLIIFLVNWILNQIMSLLIVGAVLLVAIIGFKGPAALLSIEQKMLGMFNIFREAVLWKMRDRCQDILSKMRDRYQDILSFILAMPEKDKTFTSSVVIWICAPLTVTVPFLGLLLFAMPFLFLVFSGFLIKILGTILKIQDPFACRIVGLFCKPYDFVATHFNCL